MKTHTIETKAERKARIYAEWLERKRGIRRQQGVTRSQRFRQNHPTYAQDRRQDLLRLAQEYKATHPCVDCGEYRWWVLEFDHRDPRTKSFSISSTYLSGRSQKALLAEIDKCDVRCANCHRHRHYRDRHPNTIDFDLI